MTTITAAASPTGLVPGNVDACRAEAAVLNGRSQDYDTLDLTLRSTVNQVDWAGHAYTAFVECVTTLRNRVQRASTDFARGSSALAEFAHTLEWGQGEAERAIGLWTDADRKEKAALAAAATGPASAHPKADQSTAKRKAQLIVDDAIETVNAGQRDLLKALHELAASAPRSLFAASPSSILAGGKPGSLLEKLSLLYGSNLALFLKQHPQLLAELTKLGGEAIANWWGTLSNAQRADLIGRIPTVIGNLEGVPYADRDKANVSRLKDELANAKRTESQLRNVGASLAAVQSASDRVKALEFLLDRYGDGLGPMGTPPEFLLALDTSKNGIPLASISVGNLDTATTANWLIPGMESSLLQADDYLRGATNLNFSNPNSATVLFLGYDSPKMPTTDVLMGSNAREGGTNLAAALAGYNAVRDYAGVHSELNVIGHSYGTPVVTNALASTDLHVNNVILVASAGIEPGISASDLHVEQGVYATQGVRDNLADVGRDFSGRTDPRDTGFGATTFSSDGITLSNGTVLAGVTGHNAVGGTEAGDQGHYLGRGTESLWNIQQIIEGGHVIPPLTLAPGPSLAQPIL